MDEQRHSIYDLSSEQFLELFKSLEEPGYRASQVWGGMYKKFYSTPEELLNLPSKLREKIAQLFVFTSLIHENELKSRDGDTQKVLFKLRDGKSIETVLMKYDSRNSLCISTQAGCAMGCVFCATGQMGFYRNLSTGEMVEQVIYFARELAKTGEKLTNIVVMGMGEPFNNFDNTMKAIDILNNPQGFNFGERRFTISTVGIIPGIQKFTELDRQVNLAISLHSADNKIRSTLLPSNRKYPIEDIIQSVRLYILKTNRRVTFEYALIQGVNDSIADANHLASLLKGLLCHVNLITLNPTNTYSGDGSNRAHAALFQQALADKGIPCTLRLKRGIEIQAGCGQLAGKQIS